MAKTNGFLRKSKCAKSCLRQGKTPSDASNLGRKEQEGSSLDNMVDNNAANLVQILNSTPEP